MKITVMRPVEIDAGCILCLLPIEGEDGIPDYMLDFIEDGKLRLTLDIATRRVLEWWRGKPYKLTMKPRDEGTYELFGTDGKLLAKIHENYVPNCIPGECGDYIEFDIDADGILKNWQPSADEIRVSFFTDGSEK